MREDGRGPRDGRELNIKCGFIRHADGSVLIECGETRVICTVTLEAGVPPFRMGSGEGWLSAEYAMLPASTGKRKSRETYKADGRSTEIKRLIGRALRAAVDMSALGENTVWVDCDVIDADGGTRTASITGAYVALCLAARKWVAEGKMERSPVCEQIAAVSVGIVNGECLCDLKYSEDSSADVDMNIVKTGSGKYVEVQGTGEKSTFGADELSSILSGADECLERIFTAQRNALEICDE